MKNTKKRAAPAFKISTAIIIATIGCLGTFITALFGYLAVKSQIEIPIKATQTAEMLMPKTTPTLPPTLIVDPTSTPTVDWNTILRASSSFTQCGNKVVPEFISLNPKDMQLSLANYSREFSKQYGLDWNNAIATYQFFTLESSAPLNWVKIENHFFMNVLVESYIPDNLNIVWVSGCGGGFDRDFPEVELNNQNNLSQYRIKLEYPDVDFFTLQPGEFESFRIPLECKAPGIYSITLETNTEYIGQPLVYTIVPPTKIYCPYKYSGWSSGFPQDLKYEGEFEWDGDKYQLVP